MKRFAGIITTILFVCAIWFGWPAQATVTTTESNTAPTIWAQIDNYHIVFSATPALLVESDAISVKGFSGATIQWASDEYSAVAGTCSWATLEVYACNHVGGATAEGQPLYLTPISGMPSVSAVTATARFGFYSLDLDPAVEEITFVFSATEVAYTTATVDAAFTRKR